MRISDRSASSGNTLPANKRMTAETENTRWWIFCQMLRMLPM